MENNINGDESLSNIDNIDNEENEENELSSNNNQSNNQSNINHESTGNESNNDESTNNESNNESNSISIDAQNLAISEGRKLYISNISPITSIDTFRSYFQQFGELEDCILMNKLNGNKIYGFIIYKSILSITRVMNSNFMLDNKKIDCQIAIPKENNNINNKLFIGGIPFHIKTSQVRDYFSKYGEILECMVMEDKDTKKSRGFGFVTFCSDEITNNVFNMSHKIDGKAIDLRKAESKVNLSNLQVETPQELLRLNKKLFVGGLSYTTTDEVLRLYFSQYGHVADAVVMIDKETKKSRGFGFVTFENDDIADNVVKSQPHKVDGKVVEIKKAESKTRSDEMSGRKKQESYSNSGNFRVNIPNRPFIPNNNSNQPINMFKAPIADLSSSLAALSQKLSAPLNSYGHTHTYTNPNIYSTNNQYPPYSHPIAAPNYAYPQHIYPPNYHAPYNPEQHYNSSYAHNFNSRVPYHDRRDYRDPRDSDPRNNNVRNSLKDRDYREREYNRKY